MARAVILIHADHEGPARVAEILTGAGYSLDVRAVHRGDEVPAALEADAPLVVMGGAMGVGDRDRPEYPFLQREIALLTARVRDRAPALGVCLGAQLLAHAAGADVAPMRVRQPQGAHYEVGWGDVRFDHGPGARALDGLPPSAPMLHWHGDAFTLPPGARRLASSAACAQQAFQLHDRLFGLQFHAEVRAREVEDYLQGDAAYVAMANGPRGAEIVRRDTERHWARFLEVSDRLLRNVIREMTGGG